MGKINVKTGAGMNISSLTLFSEENWKGESYVTEESQTQLKKFCKFAVKSLAVKGNPWLLYGEPGYAGRPSLVEDGRYPDFISLNNMQFESSRLVVEELASPIVVCHDSSKFKGEGQSETADAPYLSLEGRTMRSAAVGTAGCWAVAKDNTLWVRGGSFGKTSSYLGENWTKCQSSPIKLLSVGSNCVWCIDTDGHIVVRTEVTAGSPAGKTWANVDGEMKSISVSPSGHVWAVDKSDRIWWRKGSKVDSPTGSTWKPISGNLKQVSVGPLGVWGLDSKNEVYFREGTMGDADETEGTLWLKLDGKFIDICVGANMVWALGSNRDIYYRAGIDGDVGSHWCRLEQSKEKKIVFKQISVTENTLIGTDKDNNIFYKFNSVQDLQGGVSTLLCEDTPNFDQWNFPNRGSSYKVISGGWAFYSEPDFKGKVTYQLPGECISNDPPSSTEEEFKQYAAQFGSCRPIRGLVNRTVLIQVDPQWEKMKIDLQKELVFEEEMSNDTFEPIDCTWNHLLEVQCSLEHRLKLDQLQNLPDAFFKGIRLHVPPVDSIEIPVPGGPSIYTGPEFHSLLEDVFTMKNELEADQRTQRLKILGLPKYIQGKSKTKVSVYIFKYTLRVPCRMIFKMGFMPQFQFGSEQWSDTGVLESVDRTFVKVETDNVSTNMARKFSKIKTTNGHA